MTRAESRRPVVTAGDVEIVGVGPAERCHTVEAVHFFFRLVVVRSWVHTHRSVVRIVNAWFTKFAEGDVRAIPSASHVVATECHGDAEFLVHEFVVHVAEQEVVVVLVVADSLFAIVAFFITRRVVWALQLAEFVVDVETASEVESQTLYRKLNVERHVTVDTVFLVAVECFVKNAIRVVGV